MPYYSEANYPSLIASYKFAINNSFNVEIATEILYIIKHVLRRRLKPGLLVLVYLCAILKVDVLNIHDEKFGRPQRSQLCKPLYVMVVIPIQSLWYQVSHESQHNPAVFQVTALLQEPQGYLSILGPGFGSGAYELYKQKCIITVKQTILHP
jgi:hypothetical protein